MQEALGALKTKAARFTAASVAKGVPNGGFLRAPGARRNAGQSARSSQETFAPILYVIGYETLDEAIAIHNDVPQGLSSSIFTTRPA